MIYHLKPKFSRPLREEIWNKPLDLIGSDLRLIHLQGKGSAQFLNNLITRKIIDSPDQKMELGAILSNKAKVLYLFLIFKTDQGFILLHCDPTLYRYLDDRIFLEEVRISEIKPIQLYYLTKKSLSFSSPKSSLLDLYKKKKITFPSSGIVQTEKEIIIRLKLIDLEEMIYLQYDHHHEKNDLTTTSSEEIDLWNQLVIENDYFFLNLSLMNHLKNSLSILELDLSQWISIDKGCYPGQEITLRFLTQKKTYFQKLILILLPESTDFNQTTFDQQTYLIKNQGIVLGEAVYLGFSTLHNRYFLLARIKKDYWLNQTMIHFSFLDQKITGEIKAQPNSNNLNQLKQTLEKALLCYHRDDLIQAKKILTQAMIIHPDHPDILEILAVIAEKENRYQDAIKLNQQFSKRNPQAVMAHTNLSRLYMRQGLIEKAEEEKQKATVLMFKQTAKETKEKALTEKKEKLKIFEQVLAMDPDDEIANYGKGKIHYEVKEYDQAIEYLKRVIKVKSDYSVAYLYLTKSLFEKQQYQTCLDWLKRGIKVAESNQDLMPLQAMKEVNHKINSLKP